MYTSFFGLNEKPFSITPDPRYLFMSERHAEALAHLIYGVKESGGFIQLTGEVGTGKTTLVRTLLQQLPERADVALILNPQLSRVEFLTAICEELGVELPEAKGSIKALTDALNTFLLVNHGRGRRTILIVDEAQNLRPDVLEQVRLLTNLETAKQKLLQIILIGQPELRTLLARNDMRQLAQRITGRYHLQPLTREEAVAYIDHRVKVAGGVGQVFEVPAKREIFRHARGIPRMINVIADRAMLGAFAVESHQVTPALVRQAASEVYDNPGIARPRWRSALMAGALIAAAVLVVAGGAWVTYNSVRAQAPESTVATATAAPARVAPAAGVAGSVERSDPADDLAGLLSSNSAFTDLDTAFAGLFRLWGKPYARSPLGPCETAERFNLHCLFQRGNLDELRALDIPVIVSLRDAAGAEHQIVLSGLRDEMAFVGIGSQEYRVRTADLERLWSGDYQLLWRPQTAEVKAFAPGMRDPDVRWLRASLARVQGRPFASMASDLYDAELETRVKDYQRGRHLTADGLVSNQTQIAIISDLRISDMPRLARLN